MALRLSNVGAGDEVLTPALNCMASSTAVPAVGATPVWVDVDRNTLTVDLTDCARAPNPRANALIVSRRLLRGRCGRDQVSLPRSRACSHRGRKQRAGRALGAPAGWNRGPLLGPVLSREPAGERHQGCGAALRDLALAKRAPCLRRFGVGAACFRDAEREIASDTDVANIGFFASVINASARLAAIT